MSDKTFYAQLLTPNGALFEGDVTIVDVPGSEGRFEILYNHSPIVSTLGIGRIEITTEENKTLRYAVSGGFLEGSDNRITILAEEAVEASTIDLDEVKAAREQAKKALQGTTTGREILEKQLAEADNLIKTAETAS
ncbi:MAG: ATP synthase F1 subunit epsilon [Balneolaceae bacterium]